MNSKTADVPLKKRWYKRHVNVFRPSVLFMAVSNSARTQMAEALLKHHAGERFEVYSAGLEAGQIHPHARIALEELGISMQGQYPKALKDFLGLTFHYLITLSEEQEDAPIFPGVSTRLDWMISPPAEDDLNAFRRVRNQLDLQIQHFLVDCDLQKLGVKMLV